MWVFVVTCELIELYHKYVVHDVSTQLLVDDKDILQIFSMQCQAVIWAVFFILSACKILLAVICRCLIGPLWHFIKSSGDYYFLFLLRDVINALSPGTCEDGSIG